MADISSIQIKGTNGQVETYNIKDEEARNNITNINNTINELQKQKKYIFMGDSYGDGYSPDGNVTSWITLVANKLNLKSNEYISSHQGGYKFAYSSSDNFISLLQNLTSDEILTDMFVCAGFNDMTSSEVDIDLGIQNFNNLFKTKFPNAKLHIGFIGWSNLGNNIRRLSTAYNYYKKSCEKYNIDFIYDIVYALHNYFKYFSSDGYHPNQNGQNSIANALYNYITKNTANIFEKEPFYFTPVSGAIQNSNCYMILNNGIITGVLNGATSSNISFTFETVLSQSGNTPLKIADLTNSLAVGTDYNDCCFQGVPCIINDGTGTYSTHIIDLIIKNQGLYLVNCGAEAGNYKSISIKQIQIPIAIFSMSALLC